MLKHLTTADFDQAVANGAVVVDFFADWCGPCRMLAPVLEKLAQENSDVAIYKVNVDDEPELARRFGIMSIPTMLFFKDGQLIDKTVGALGKPAIQSKLDQLR
ncbi:MAG: thioredoxin [Christensenellales bacterium]|jgi:thioredoxin 1